MRISDWSSDVCSSDLHSSFTKNRDRLLEGEIAAKFLRAVLAQPRVKRLISSDHFSVDGTLIEAWASLKSFRRKDGSDRDGDGPGRNAERDFHGEKRRSEEHTSELQSLMRSSYAVLCLKKKKHISTHINTHHDIHRTLQPQDDRNH